MREIRFIERPEHVEPCPECGRTNEVCLVCQEDIARAVRCVKEGIPWERQGELFAED